MTIRDAARQLEVSTKTIHNLIYAGKLQARRIGVGRGTIRITPESFEAYKAESLIHPYVEELVPQGLVNVVDHIYRRKANDATGAVGDSGGKARTRREDVLRLLPLASR